jgi:hypothetical protein
VGGFDKIVSMEEDGCCHEAGSSSDTLAAAEEHGKVNDDAIEA